MEQEAEQPVPIQVECSDDGSCPTSSSQVSQVRKLLFRQMLVGIKDGRFFVGGFYCIDKQGNIILQDAVEYRSTRRSSPSPMEQRCLGLILIPSSCRTSCHVDCSVEEQLSLLSLHGKWLLVVSLLFWCSVNKTQDFSVSWIPQPDKIQECGTCLGLNHDRRILVYHEYKMSWRMAFEIWMEQKRKWNRVPSLQWFHIFLLPYSFLCSAGSFYLQSFKSL